MSVFVTLIWTNKGTNIFLASSKSSTARSMYRSEKFNPKIGSLIEIRVAYIIKLTCGKWKEKKTWTFEKYKFECQTPTDLTEFSWKN